MDERGNQTEMGNLRSVWLDRVDDGRVNNLNLIRLVLASAVIFSHAYVLLNQFANEPFHHLLHFGDLGGTAVFSFFFISGFLISRSAIHHKDPVTFITARILRIFPGLIAAVLLCTFVIGPIFTRTSIREYFSSKATYSYMSAMFLHHGNSNQLPGLFESNFVAYAVNGPLWTLSSEWTMYMVTLIGCLIFRWRTIHTYTSRSWIMLIVAVLFTVQMFPLPLQYATPWIAFFLLGAACYLCRAKIKLVPLLALSVLLIDLLLIRFLPHAGKPLFPFALSYFLLVAGFHPGLSAQWFLRFGDFSYGLYIYAWPVQQILARWVTIPLRLFFYSYMITLPLAVVSWYLIEAPSLSKKQNLERQKMAISSAVAQVYGPDAAQAS
jgi:peptidoglycan/LPS O-acetylase OafA/YrhL